MKKFIASLAIAAIMAMSGSAFAQTGEKIRYGVKKGAHKVEYGIKKAAHKTANKTSNAYSRVTNTQYKDRTGPRGERLYADHHGHSYYVNSRGRRVYVHTRY